MSRETTLIEHAEAWMREQGMVVPERDTLEHEVAYRKWVDFAFSSLSSSNTALTGPQLEKVVRVFQELGLSLTVEGLHQVEDGIIDELDSKGLGRVIGDALGVPYRYKRVAERIYQVLES